MSDIYMSNIYHSKEQAEHEARRNAIEVFFYKRPVGQLTLELLQILLNIHNATAEQILKLEKFKQEIEKTE